MRGGHKHSSSFFKTVQLEINPFLLLGILTTWLSCAPATSVSGFRESVFSLTGSDAISLTGSNATLSCRPSDGAVIARDETTRSLVDCCRSCVDIENCEMVAFSEEQGVCLLYDQRLSRDHCAALGHWKVASKGEANHTVGVHGPVLPAEENMTTVCLNGFTVKADGFSCQCYGGYVGDRCQKVMEGEKNWHIVAIKNNGPEFELLGSNICGDCYEAKLSGHYPSLGRGDQQMLLAQARLMEQPVQVQCQGNGNMVLQRRSSTPADFNRTWQEYVDGFEEDGKDFWLGLQNMYLFTNSKQYDLNVNLFLANDARYYLNYHHFRLTENITFTASLGPFLKTNLNDHLQNMSGQPFSTYDNDNDNAVDSNCAQRFGGGWWFDACADYNFNGRLEKTGVWSGEEDQVHYKDLGNAAPTSMFFKA